MLTNCPECSKEISGRAITCPNCGCPIGKRLPALEKDKRPNFISEISWLIIIFSFMGIMTGYTKFGVGVAIGIFGLILARIYEGMRSLDD